MKRNNPLLQRLSARILPLFFAVLILSVGGLTVLADEVSSEAASEAASQAAPTATIPEPGAVRACLDLADVITPETEQEIVDKNKALDKKGEIVIVTVNSTGDMDSAAFAEAVFKKWEIGSAYSKKGVLLLLDITGDTYYALSGEGLSEVFPLSVLSEILSTNLETDFSAKNYDSGIKKTFSAFATAIDNPAAPTAPGKDSSKGTESKGENTIFSAFWGVVKIILIIIAIILVLAVAFVIIANARAQKRRKRRRGAGSRSATGRATQRREPRSRR